MDELTAIKKATKVAGGPRPLAEAIKADPSFTWQWFNDKRRVPPRWCPAIEGATGVRCEDLRPDVTWLRDKRGRITGYSFAVKAA